MSTLAFRKALFIFLASIGIAGCSGMGQIGSGFYLMANPVSWCMSEYTFIKDETERRKHCEGPFMADRRATQAAIDNAGTDEQRAKDAQDRRQAIAAVTTGLVTQGSTKDRVKAMNEVLAAAPISGGGAASNAGADAGGGGSCSPPSNYTIIKDVYNSNPRTDRAIWPANQCGSVVLRPVKGGVMYGFQNSCNCEIILNVLHGNNTMEDRVVKANQLINPTWHASDSRPYPKAVGSCPKLLPVDRYPGFRAENQMCSAPVCELTNSCGYSGGAGVAR